MGTIPTQLALLSGLSYFDISTYNECIAVVNPRMLFTKCLDSRLQPNIWVNPNAPGEAIKSHLFKCWCVAVSLLLDGLRFSMWSYDAT